MGAAVRPTPVEPILRRPIGRDTAPLVELYARARRSCYEGHLPEAELVEWSEGLRAEGLDHDRPDRLWTCAEVGGVPAGFALVSFDGGLLQLQVDPPHRGAGVGPAEHDHRRMELDLG
ncbi:hypothetical protein Amir_1212 [Actinosynnema mirum DSM 43827]|uniref:N-acetyltransferase domain-containing protein n=1 Tax=Actinosynnema mirum (strain ATCC 29888 / DSM 43827 / JCM 3225 / NBRC 14064 / NCIMB 13271 / NRRL B-12336 / IMRU 3971 / 101) TaxID=446462 RepID=C6WRB2_ACTMD|nr:hypothetical protein Amir_1212 [Actinosynnema mirum DSM 43827]